MEELLTLEPRFVGEDTAEPDVRFIDGADSVHMECYCENTRILCTSSTLTLFCEESTKIC